MSFGIVVGIETFTDAITKIKSFVDGFDIFVNDKKTADDGPAVIFHREQPDLIVALVSRPRWEIANSLMKSCFVSTWQSKVSPLILCTKRRMQS